MKREKPDLIQRKADPVNLGATLITTMHSCHSLGSLLGIKESHHTSIDQSPVCVPCDCGSTKDTGTPNPAPNL